MNSSDGSILNLNFDVITQSGASTASAPPQKQFGGFLDLRREFSDDSDD